MHQIDGTVLGLFATILVTLGRMKLAAIIGGIGIWIVARSMRERGNGAKGNQRVPFVDMGS
jgi:hypothetical protein